MPMTFKISSEFGAVEQVRNNIPHTGLDIPMEIGTKLRAFVDGKVERIIDYGTQNLGKGVVIRGEDGNAYIYGHLSKITVEKGDTIHAGRDIIGLSGNTGNSTGPHLHFSIQTPSGEFIDPTPAVKALQAVTGGDPLNQFIGDQPLPHTWLDWLNHKADGAVISELNTVDKVTHPVGNWFQTQATHLGHWIVENIPDLMGYGAILAGAIIILGAMFGRGGMYKPLAVYAGSLILAVLLRGGGN